MTASAQEPLRESAATMRGALGEPLVEDSRTLMDESEGLLAHSPWRELEDVLVTFCPRSPPRYSTGKLQLTCQDVMSRLNGASNARELPVPPMCCAANTPDEIQDIAEQQAYATSRKRDTHASYDSLIGTGVEEFFLQTRRKCCVVLAFADMPQISLG